MRNFFRMPVLLACLAARPAPALAHDVTFSLRGPGEAQMAFRYQDGSPMAEATAALFGPANDVLPVWTGQTDAAGEVALRGAGDGLWRIDVQDMAGHASRARLRVTEGVVRLAGQSVPEWLVEFSLLANVALATALAWILRHRPRLVLQTSHVHTSEMGTIAS